MSSALPPALSLAVAAAAHQRPRWTLPQTAPLLPTMTIPLTLSSLRPQPKMKICTSARWWRLKTRASVHSRTVPVNPPQLPCSCHRAAVVALCPAAALCAAATAADAAAAAALSPSCHQRCPITLSPPLQHPRCCNRAAAVTLCTAATLCAAATACVMRTSTRRPLPDMFRKIFAQWEQSF